MSRCGTAPRGGLRAVADALDAARHRPFLVPIDVIKARANEHAREIAAELLPNGRENCGYWETSNIADVYTGKFSLKVTLRGADRGMWCDHGCRGTLDGGGDIIQLVERARFGGDRGQAIAWLKSYLGLDDLDPRRLAAVKAEAAIARARDERQASEAAEDNRRRALGLWVNGVPLIGTPVEAYLRGRGIDLSLLAKPPGAIVFHPEVYNVEAKRKLPCMLGAIVRQGRHIATHRTWLAPDGRGGWTKADLEEPKKVLGSFKGGYIPLNKGLCRKTLEDIDAGVDVWGAEGIEDGLSAAAAKPAERIVAGVTLGNLGDLELPDQVGRFIIIGQRDTNPKTLEALERAVGRQQERDREVWLTPPPAGGFKDVNEALQAERGIAA